MLAKKSRIENFDDWVDIFHQWHADIGYPTELLGQDYHFETKLDEIESNEIEFGHFAGRPKWEKLTDIPDQRIRAISQRVGRSVSVVYVMLYHLAPGLR